MTLNESSLRANEMVWPLAPSVLTNNPLQASVPRPFVWLRRMGFSALSRTANQFDQRLGTLLTVRLPTKSPGAGFVLGQRETCGKLEGSCAFAQTQALTMIPPIATCKQTLFIFIDSSLFLRFTFTTNRFYGGSNCCLPVTWA